MFISTFIRPFCDVMGHGAFSEYDMTAVIGYTATITVGSGSRSLSSAEYNCDLIVFSGTLTANESYTFPVLGRLWMVDNQSEGAFSLSVLKTGGTAQAIPANEVIEVRS